MNGNENIHECKCMNVDEILSKSYTYRLMCTPVFDSEVIYLSMNRNARSDCTFYLYMEIYFLLRIINLNFLYSFILCRIT